MQPFPASTPVQSLQASPLAAVLAHASVLEQVGNALIPLFPPLVAQNLRICNYQNGVLVVLVASPVWKAKLRMIKGELISKAEQAGVFVRDIEVRSVLALPLLPQDAPAQMAGSPAACKALKEALQLLETGG